MGVVSGVPRDVPTGGTLVTRLWWSRTGVTRASEVTLPVMSLWEGKRKMDGSRASAGEPFAETRDHEYIEVGLATVF